MGLFQTHQGKASIKRTWALGAAVALCVVAVVALAGCQPAQGNVSATGKTGDPSMNMPGDFQNLDAGVLTETDFNTNFVNAGNRGCKACHDDLWDVMNDLTPLQHIMSSPAGYGQTYGITDCMTCHNYNLAMGGPKLSDLLHTAHYANSAFTDDQNGNCWSCHATTVDGEIVLFDRWKYTSEMGGYPNAEAASMQQWLTGRTYENASMVDVVSIADLNLDVEVSQAPSDEADVFIADNFVVPELSADTWRLTVKGAKEEREFTLDDLRALPQTEYTVTQDCLTNAINGVLIGNIPVKGVLVKDLVEACGGLPEGTTSMACMGIDGWGHTTTLELLTAQNAMIATSYFGHDLTADQGYPATLVIPGVGGALWDKWLGEITFGNDETAYGDTWMLKAGFPDAFQGVQTSGWFTPGEDGETFKAGEPVAIDGYAYLNANNGHALKQVAFSADYGQTWKYVDVPANFDQKQWAQWAGTWTPEKAGTYVLHVKAVDELGEEQAWPASVIVKVTE